MMKFLSGLALLVSTLPLLEGTYYNFIMQTNGNVTDCTDDVWVPLWESLEEAAESLNPAYATAIGGGIVPITTDPGRRELGRELWTCEDCMSNPCLDPQFCCYYCQSHGYVCGSTNPEGCNNRRRLGDGHVSTAT
jgi:hypothetical protein